MAAQAIEIMSALLQGGLVEWINTRGPAHGSVFEEFDFQFCGLDGVNEEFPAEKQAHREFLKSHLKSFSDSLSEYIIDSLELQYEDTMVDNIRFARFTLKHHSKDSVVISLNFARGSDDASTVWGPWCLDPEKAIECKLHSDHQLQGGILFGWK